VFRSTKSRSFVIAENWGQTSSKEAMVQRKQKNKVQNNGGQGEISSSDKVFPYKIVEGKNHA